MLSSARGLLLLTSMAAGYLTADTAFRGVAWGIAITCGLFLFIDIAELMRKRT